LHHRASTGAVIVARNSVTTPKVYERTLATTPTGSSSTEFTRGLRSSGLLSSRTIAPEHHPGSNVAFARNGFDDRYGEGRVAWTR
jgi:hypothetical protein